MSETYPYLGCQGKYTIPQKVKNAASLGLEMHSSGFKGGTQTGWNRARQLIKCDHVSEKTIRTMKAWYARHTYTSYPGYQKWTKAGSPKTPTPQTKNIYRGAVAWLIWGGDPAKEWLADIKLE